MLFCVNNIFVKSQFLISGIDLPIVRYAEVLLSYLEAKLENWDFYGEPFPTAKNLRVKPGGAKDTYGRWYVTSKAFRKGTDNQWPIPQSEVNINPNLQ